ncbi:hypothetical protein T484DRAFT_1902033, partial [Baffinella frigidus]
LAHKRLPPELPLNLPRCPYPRSCNSQSCNYPRHAFVTCPPIVLSLPVEQERTRLLDSRNKRAAPQARERWTSGGSGSSGWANAWKRVKARSAPTAAPPARNLWSVLGQRKAPTTRCPSRRRVAPHGSSTWARPAVSPSRGWCRSCRTRPSKLPRPPSAADSARQPPPREASPSSQHTTT